MYRRGLELLACVPSNQLDASSAKRVAPSRVAAGDYGRALFLDSWAGSALFRSVVHPLFHQQIVGPKIDQTAGDATVIDAVLKQAAPQAFSHLEALTPKAQLVADTLSIADLAVVSRDVV